MALHFFEAASHIPPPFSQSAGVMYCERSLALLPDGLADGVLVELPDDVPAPGVVLGVPEDVPEPELPALPLPVPLVCAAAIAGIRAIIATKTPIVGILIFDLLRVVNGLVSRFNGQQDLSPDNADRVTPEPHRRSSGSLEVRLENLSPNHPDPS